MKSVVMLVNEFTPLVVGGAERQAERLSTYLAARGWTVQVLTRRAPGLPAREMRDGFTIIRPPAFGPGKIQTLLFVFGTLLYLWRNRKSYQLLHAHLAFGPAFAAVVAAHFLGKRVIVKLGNSGHFGDIQVSLKTWRGRLRLAVLRRWADMIIVLDDLMEAEALSAGFTPEKVRRMINGIDGRAFYPRVTREKARNALGLGDKVVVLSMGRLSAQKSLPFLIQAFANARASCPELHLMILGDGPERQRLEKLAGDLNIGALISFCGNQADVLPYLSAADIFALPSASEGISNALLESMSAGLACVATPVGGNSQVLDQGSCGLLLPVGDLLAWSSAFVQLGKSEELRARLGNAARERVNLEYDFDVVGVRFEKLYTELSDQLINQSSDLAQVER